MSLQVRGVSGLLVALISIGLLTGGCSECLFLCTLNSLLLCTGQRPMRLACTYSSPRLLLLWPLPGQRGADQHDGSGGR